MIFPTWSIEKPRKAKAIRQSFLGHAARYPNHLIRYIRNTPGEARLLEEFGQPATFLNQNSRFQIASSGRFQAPALNTTRSIMPGSSGQTTRAGLQIESVAYISYCEGQASRQEEFKRLWHETKTRSPAHVLLNDLADDLPVGISHAGVNAALSRASTGLLLSEVEGASYAAVEYMLAGLSVVSTPSAGGRDAYFDPEYALSATPILLRFAMRSPHSS